MASLPLVHLITWGIDYIEFQNPKSFRLVDGRLIYAYGEGTIKDENVGDQNVETVSTDTNRSIQPGENSTEPVENLW